MTLYQIVTRGCDDATEVELDLTAEEAGVIARAAVAINRASSHDCMPRLYIAKVATESTEGN